MLQGGQDWRQVKERLVDRVLVSIEHLLDESDIMEVGSSRFKGPIPEILG